MLSKAFEKSNAMRWTYWFEINIVEIMCRVEIIAAVVDPDGLKANWSVKERFGGGDVKHGYKNFRTIVFSTALERTEVIEIGLKSMGPVGFGTFGSDVMHAGFHWEGTLDVRRERLMRYVRDGDVSGAANWRNQAGNISSPVAVLERLSSM